MRDPNGWIGTRTGTKFWPLEPRGDEIKLEDIAHSLSRQCRFNGHCGPFYSVAEHSVEVSLQVPGALALWGLMHDAAEAYLSDIVRPLKGRCAYAISDDAEVLSYWDAEQQLLEPIAMRFELLWPMPEMIYAADDRMLATERQQLFDERQPHWPSMDGIEPYPITLRCFDPNTAEKLFMARFLELTDGTER